MMARKMAIIGSLQCYMGFEPQQSQSQFVSVKEKTTGEF
jgi:hypothetical protein